MEKLSKTSALKYYNTHKKSFIKYSHNVDDKVWYLIWWDMIIFKNKTILYTPENDLISNLEYDWCLLPYLFDENIQKISEKLKEIYWYEAVEFDNRLTYAPFKFRCDILWFEIITYNPWAPMDKILFWNYKK
jgi:hypothetical protein